MRILISALTTENSRGSVDRQSTGTLPICTTCTTLSWRSTGSRPLTRPAQDLGVGQSTGSRPAKTWSSRTLHGRPAVDRHSTAFVNPSRPAVDRRSTARSNSGTDFRLLSFFIFLILPWYMYDVLVLFVLHTCTAWLVTWWILLYYASWLMLHIAIPCHVKYEISPPLHAITQTPSMIYPTFI